MDCRFTFRCWEGSVLDLDPGIPPLRAGQHQRGDLHIPVYPDLAAQPELAQNPILFKAIVLDLPHGRLIGMELDPARGAARIAPAPVADVDPVAFDRFDEFCAFGDIERTGSRNRDFVACHRA